MRKLLAHLAVALMTFTVGVCASTPRVGRQEQVVVVIYPPPVTPAPLGPTACTLRFPETPEDKAVRLAVEFVAHSGYTASAGNMDGLRLDRYDVLEPQAYGFTFGQNGKTGYTVVFRYTNGMGDYSKRVGRAVTMDADFHNLRIGHKDFFLKAVEKKL